MNQPWLSILIPTYNGNNYLRFALDSILSQGDCAGFECIAIDDGSTDDTLTILNSYLDKLPIKIIQSERKGNWVSNTNYALSIATAKYVCFLHQDDIWLKNRISTMKYLIDKYPQVNLFLHSSQFIDRNGSILNLWKCPLPKLPTLITSNMMTERLLIQNFISIPAPIFKLESALKVGGLDESLWYTADWDFWLKIVTLGLTIYYPKPLSAFRVHSDSQTIVRSSYLREFQQQLEIVVDRHCPLWQASKKSRKNKTRSIADFSIQVNTTLAGIIHGQKNDLINLLISFLSLGFWGWYRYFRDSRIWERGIARLKIKLISKNKKYSNEFL
jgi:glycosyltransferase involved in cell wall biosynthesis